MSLSQPTRRHTLLGIPLAVAALATPALLAAPDMGRPTSVLSPTEFGAKANDGRDHTAAFQHALSRCAGGALILPPGIFNVRANSLRVPANTSVLGFGRGTVLTRIGDGTLLDFSGVSTEIRNGGCLLRDIVLDGVDGRGLLARCHHSHDLIFENVWFRRNNYVALDGLELWDSRFIDCTWDWCSGRDGTSPAVLMRNQALPKSRSQGNTNAIYFLNCRWESFRDGALWLIRIGQEVMSQLYLVNCKMETSYVRGPFLRISPSVCDVMVQNLYLCGNSFDRGFSTPVDLVDFSPYGMAKLEDVFVWLNAPVARTVVRSEIGHPSCSIHNLWLDGDYNPTHALLEILGRIRPEVTRVGYLKGFGGLIEINAP